MSTLPSVSLQISSAVVRRWTAGLDGLANCWRMTLFGILVASSSALAIAPFIPFAPSVSTRRAPRTLRILRALGRHRLGHREDELQPLGRRDERERDARVAARRLDEHRVLVDAAALQGVVDHGEADPVLDAREGVEELQLEQDLRLRAVGGCGPVEADERRVADRFGDVVVYLGHLGCGLVCLFGKRGWQDARWHSPRRTSGPAAGAAGRGRSP